MENLYDNNFRKYNSNQLIPTRKATVLREKDPFSTAIQ